MLGVVGNLRDVGRSQAVHVENQSRQQNILFHYMPKKRQNETWDDCGERAVRAVIKNKPKIGVDIQIDHAHRVGSSLIINKDKDLILKNAHNRTMTLE